MQNGERGMRKESASKTGSELNESPGTECLFADPRWVGLGSFFLGNLRSWGRKRGFLASFGKTVFSHQSSVLSDQ